MAIYNNLNNVRKLSSSSLTSIVDVTNLNFKSIADANLEFLSKIKYNEVLNSISINRGTFTYVDIADRLTFSINGVPTFTIDSLGRAEGHELLVKVSETKRQRFTDFPDWPDEGVPGEIIYTGIQNQRPKFGEDFIGYLDGRGWVSLTTLTSSVGYLGLTPVQGSPAVPPTVPPGDTVVWVGAPGLEDMYIPKDLTVYFTDADGNTFDIITDPVWEYIEGDQDSAKFKPLGTMIIGDLTNNGSIRYVDGNQQPGYVLTSDAFGNASWQPSTGGGGGGDLNAAYVEIVDLVANLSKTITHSLKSTDIHVQLIDLDTNELIEAQIDNYTLNTVDIVSSVDNNNVKVVILAAGGAPPGTLAGLTDVYLMSPLADGDILVYDSIAGTWVNMPNTGGGGGTVVTSDPIYGDGSIEEPVSLSYHTGDFIIATDPNITPSGSTGGLMLNLDFTTLPQPSLNMQWAVRKSDNSTLFPSTQFQNGNTVQGSMNTVNITVPIGSYVDLTSGVATIPALGPEQQGPSNVSGNFTFTPNPPITLPASSASLTVNNLTSTVSYNVTIIKPKSGLEVSNDRVVRASGNDIASLTGSVTFQNVFIYGYIQVGPPLAPITQPDVDSITGLQLESFTRFRFGGRGQTFAVNDSIASEGVGARLVIAYPASLNNLATLTNPPNTTNQVTAFTRGTNDITITTVSGIQVAYRYYVANAANSWNTTLVTT